jgi:hypothetical protein
MIESVATANNAEAEAPVRTVRSERSAAALWERYGKGALVFILLLLGYELTFSHYFGNGLSTAYELQGGRVLLVEFRHLMNHLWPFWLFQFLRGFHLHVTSLGCLHLFDLVTAAASVMLLYRVLLEITNARFISLAGAFAYATSNCVWTYTGTGRLYTTSMLLIFAAYYLALQIGKASTEGRRWLIAIAAAVMTCFACFFWLVHIFNAIGVALLILLLPHDQFQRRRIGYLGLYSITAALLILGVMVSCLHYVQVPLTLPSLEAWIAGTSTPPMKYGLRGLMQASYGQANGFVATPELLYMVHGLMLKDAVLAGLRSLPWQLGKFVFIWLLLLLVYVYPWIMLSRVPPGQRILIFALYTPLAINMFFALGWLGEATARFLPTMLSQIALGVLAMRHLMARSLRPRLLGALAVVSLIFMAGVNMFEWVLPLQREYTALAEQAKAIRSYVHRGDLLVTFGRDLSGDDTYDRMVLFYADADTFTVTNDAYAYNWDLPDWQANFASVLYRVQKSGGALFVVDRLALGFNPPHAAWSERQHPYPTVREFSRFLQTEYRVTPAFYLGSSQYFRVEQPKANCAASLSTFRQRVHP